MNTIFQLKNMSIRATNCNSLLCRAYVRHANATISYASMGKARMLKRAMPTHRTLLVTPLVTLIKMQTLIKMLDNKLINMQDNMQKILQKIKSYVAPFANIKTLQSLVANIQTSINNIQTIRRYIQIIIFDIVTLKNFAGHYGLGMILTEMYIIIGMSYLHEFVSNQKSTNIQVEEIQTQIAKIQTQVADIQTQVAEIQTQVETQVADIETDIETQVADIETDIETQVADIETDIETLAKDIMNMRLRLILLDIRRIFRIIFSDIN
ncbi:hypothetical protein N9K75_01540 [bacterium]|nr:hypothetical protein [bacterium]